GFGAGQRDHSVGAEAAQLLVAPHRARREHQRLDACASAEGVSQPSRTGHHFVRDFAQRAVALLQHGEDVAHRTFASSRSSRTSSATAAAPSPTTFPALRSGGGVMARTSRPPAPSDAGFVTSGFFFAAMMPLSAG